jgi:hypothetical protein
VIQTLARELASKQRKIEQLRWRLVAASRRNARADLRDVA